MEIAEKDHDYIRWQNRAFWFYVAARTCFHKGFHAPAAFLSQQCVEQLVKATLIWCEPSFDPKKHGGHNLHKMEKMIREKVPDQAKFTIPGYLYAEYQTLSRYPNDDGLGFIVPRTLLYDVDCLFVDLIEMVSFQWNSQLFWTLVCHEPEINPKQARYNNYYEELARGNEYVDRLYKYVVVQQNRPQMFYLRRRRLEKIEKTKNMKKKWNNMDAGLNVDELKAVQEAIDFQNQRGPGSDHVVPSHPELRQATERCIAQQFADAYAQKYEREITDIRSNENDPPDCFAYEDGKQFGIEITELLKPEIRADNVTGFHKARQRVGGRELTPDEQREQQQENYVRNYECSLWTKKEFLQSLQAVIKKKDGNKGLVNCIKKICVVLVIYTDDQNLPKADLTEWLADAVFPAQNLKEVFLRGPHEAEDNKQIRPSDPDDPGAWAEAAWMTPDYPLFRLI